MEKLEELSKERQEIVRQLQEGVKDYNALPEIEKEAMAIANDVACSSYMYDLWKNGAYVIYRRINGRLVPCM